MEVMRMKLDWFAAAGTYAELTEIHEGCNIVNAKWLYKWVIRTVWETRRRPVWWQRGTAR